MSYKPRKTISICEGCGIKKELDKIRKDVKKVLVDENLEIKQMMDLVGLDWCNKGEVDLLKNEIEELNQKIKSYEKQINKLISENGGN